MSSETKHKMRTISIARFNHVVGFEERKKYLVPTLVLLVFFTILCAFFISRLPRNRESTLMFDSELSGKSEGKPKKGGQKVEDNSKESNAVIEIYGNRTINGNERVRIFHPLPLDKMTTKLVLGSSIVRELRGDKAFPRDVDIHPYLGSTAKEKLTVLEHYPNQKLDTLILQDGSNNVMKFKKPAEQIFAEYEILIQTCAKKFNPKKFFLCEIPPMADRQIFKQQNEKINNFNKLLVMKYGNSDYFRIIKLNEKVKSVRNYTSLLFRDHVHFSYETGVPFLRDFLMPYLQ